MRRLGLIVAFFVSVSVAFGQIDSNTITVTASRNTNLQPDQVVFSVDVISGADASMDDVIAALAGSGITAANFVRLIPLQQQFALQTLQLSLDWNFTLPVPWSKMKDTIAMLTALQKSIAQKNSGLTLTFSVQGAQVSQQLAQSQTCSVSDLLADARKQAQKLADAAGLFLGGVLAMSGSTSTSSGSPASLSALAPVPGCLLTVKFAVTR